MTKAFWDYAVDPTTKIPRWFINSTTLTSISPHYSTDFNKWYYPILSMMAKLTDEPYFKNSLWKMTQTIYINYTSPITGLAPVAIINGNPQSHVEFFRATQGAYGLMVAGEILNDTRYTNLGLRQIGLIDDYMWDGPRWDNVNTHWVTSVSIDGVLLDNHVENMDADGLVAFFKAYQLTGNTTYRDHAYAYSNLLNQTQYDDLQGVPNKNILAPSGAVSFMDNRRLIFPDTILAAWLYGYYYTRDAWFYSLLNQTSSQLNYYKGSYGFGCLYNSMDRQLASPRYYEYQFYEYPDLYLLKRWNERVI